MNKIGKWISEKENVDFPFRPHREFYQKVGINKKRFWQIYRNEVAPTIDELRKIALYFQTEYQNLID